MNFLKSFLKDRGFQICLGVITIQQILVALGTYLMGDLASSAWVEGLPLFKVAILILSLVLSGSVFHYLMKYYLTIAEKGILWRYFESYSHVNYSRPSLWRNTQAKSERHDIMSREGQDAITQSVQFAADSVATSLNIVFNVISVVLVTSPAMGFSIVFAGILGLFIIQLADKNISAAAQNEMTAKNDVNAFLAKSWDNIILGNRSFFEKWSANFAILFKKSKEASLKNNKINDGAVGIASFLTSLIVVGTVFALVFLNQNESAKSLALLVMLPRSMQIVMHIQVIQSYWAHWKYLIQRLETTEKSITPPAPYPLDQFIKPARIKVFSGTRSHGLEDLINALAEPQGRFTVLGDNGAGKSTLLLKLKELVHDEGLYVPAHHQLELSENTFSKSHGEIALQTLQEAMQDSARVILLDEWDANLSQENRDTINQMIEKISRKKLVIEIRHRFPIV